MRRLFPILLFGILTHVLSAQSATSKSNSDVVEMKSDFSDRKAILKTLENFYIGDHTGSVEHMKLSMHEKGAYRYINRDGEYVESVFNLDSGHADTNYKEELLSIEIYSRLAIAKLRLKQFSREEPEFMVMTLHKANGQWKITGISWGFGITH